MLLPGIGGLLRSIQRFHKQVDPVLFSFFDARSCTLFLSGARGRRQSRRPRAMVCLLTIINLEKNSKHTRRHDRRIGIGVIDARGQARLEAFNHLATRREFIIVCPAALGTDPGFVFLMTLHLAEFGFVVALPPWRGAPPSDCEGRLLWV